MLPYFHIITNDAAASDIKSRNTTMYVQDIPPKPKRNKKPEVPVHKSEKPDKKSSQERNLKTYSANFNPKKHGKRLDGEGDYEDFDGKPVFDDPEEARLNAKLSRKHLSKENERLLVENQELGEKLQSLEDYLNKKNCKLKEKMQGFQVLNEQMSSENNALRARCIELEAQLGASQIEIQNLQNCKMCDELSRNLEQAKSEAAVHKKANSEMREDLNMLKNVVYRLNVQLERYQEKLSKHNIRIHSFKEKRTYKPDPTDSSQILTNDSYIKNALSESHWDHAHTPISWGKVNSHTLGPLLDAYQETIKEKEDIIQEYESEMAKFTTRLKDIIKENELLHKRLTEDSGCSQVLSKQLESLNAELKATKEQNDLLIKKCALKQDKVEEILKCYETKVDQMKRDYTVLHDQYCKAMNEVTAVREKNRSLIEAHDDFKHERQQYIPISVHKSSVDECKKWYEELKSQYEIEKNKLSDTISGLKSEIKDMSDKVAHINKEKTELESKIKASEKHLKKSEIKYLDLQHSLNEVQLSRSACRKQLHKAMNFAKDLVAEQEALLKALNQRHLENKAVKKLGSDIATRMDSLKNQLKLVQKDAWEELSTVEQRLQEQDSLISTMKQEHNQEIDRLKRIIQEKDENPLLKENVSSIPLPHYLLYKDKHFHT